MADYEFTVILGGSGGTEGEAWTDAVDAFCADPGEPHSVVNLEDGTQEFTVMLLRPDYKTDNYGQDTYTCTVTAEDAEDAIDQAKQACFLADFDEDESSEWAQYRKDLYVLAVMKGWVEFIE